MSRESLGSALFMWEKWWWGGERFDEYINSNWGRWNWEKLEPSFLLNSELTLRKSFDVSEYQYILVKNIFPPQTIKCHVHNMFYFHFYQMSFPNTNISTDVNLLGDIKLLLLSLGTCLLRGKIMVGLCPIPGMWPAGTSLLVLRKMSQGWALWLPKVSSRTDTSTKRNSRRSGRVDWGGGHCKREDSICQRRDSF